MVFAPDGLTLFVTAFGSGKIAAIDTNALEAGTVSEQQVAVGRARAASCSTPPTTAST